MHRSISLPQFIHYGAWFALLLESDRFAALQGIFLAVLLAVAPLILHLEYLGEGIWCK